MSQTKPTGGMSQYRPPTSFMTKAAIPKTVPVKQRQELNPKIVKDKGARGCVEPFKRRMVIALLKDFLGKLRIFLG